MTSETQTTMQPPEDELWNALVNRTSLPDKPFLYGVRTTGIYCRPGCRSRLPRRENTRFFSSCTEAEKAGFRACKRCRPADDEVEAPHQKAILQACELIARADTSPLLSDLADAAGLSPYHFQRVFKKTVGITPNQYYLQHRVNRVQAELVEENSITNAIYQSGYGSNSRFYSQAAGTLGMKPAEYKKGGEGQSIVFAVTRCYLGWVLVAATERGICVIDFGDAPENLETRLQTRFPNAQLIKDSPDFSDRVEQVIDFLENPQTGLNLPLDVRGTAFQRRVWEALCSIPCGSTSSYAGVAARIGSPKSVRAVAQACAANQIAAAIPCHRVVRSNGDLGGYRWGLDRKRKLLEIEQNLQKIPPGD